MSTSALPSLPAFTDFSLCSGGPPSRKIFTEQDLAQWTASEPHHLLQLIIARLSSAVEGRKLEDSCYESEATKRLVAFLDRAEGWVEGIPLQTTPQRFGNKAFREWIALLEQHAPSLQASLLSAEQQPVLAELSHHFLTSFGSASRLDYGTGHELSFLAYLLILRLIGVLTEQDEQAIVTRVFVRYLSLVRKLQTTFKLEPAGSKGVWGLDDHQHLVYLWGASQLRTHPTLLPSSLLEPSTLVPHSSSYLFLQSLLHIHDLKSSRAQFAEHSPLLHSIASTVPNWFKVQTGLMKMYEKEVMEKLPVVQHFWFGGVLGWRKAEVDPQSGELLHPFRGEVMPSTGDGLAEEEIEALESDTDAPRERDEGTVAPWAIPGRQTPVPFAFAAPTLFPRRSSPLVGEGGDRGEEGKGTVADEGGAAAASSPFGVLGRPSLS